MSAQSPLPPLPVWHARSFYAQLLLLASVALSFAGFDLSGWLAGFGLTEGRVLDAVEAAVPLAFGVWAWLERRAPKFRLVWRLRA